MRLYASLAQLRTPRSPVDGKVGVECWPGSSMIAQCLTDHERSISGGVVSLELVVLCSNKHGIVHQTNLT